MPSSPLLGPRLTNQVSRRAEAGTAFIVSSHLLSLIEDLCTTILILHRGRLVLYERLADLRARVLAEGRQETLEDLFFRLTEKAV